MGYALLYISHCAAVEKNNCGIVNTSIEGLNMH